MYLHGADGLTMDDIAKGMKMSKRTLYKLFPSKTCLFRICLSDFTNGIRSCLKQSQMRMDSSCMQVLFATVNGYLTLLHSLGKTLLLDIAANEDYRASFKREAVGKGETDSVKRETLTPKRERGLLVAAVYRCTDALQNLGLPASGSRSGSLCGRFAGGYLSELPARYSVCCSADAEPYSLTRAF